MHHDYTKLKANALKDYDNAIKEIDMWERIEKNIIRAQSKNIKEFAIKTEIRVWNEVDDYMKKLDLIAKDYGFVTFKIIRNEDDFTVYLKKI